MAGALTYRNRLILLFIFILYTVVRVGSSLPAFEKPRQTADTTAYLRISKATLTDDEFWGSSRPFVFPLLLKLTGQNLRVAAGAQLGFSIISWSLLALVLASFASVAWIAILSFLWILLLSLMPHLAGWDFTMLSESLSISWFILTLASGLWLLKEWTWQRVVLMSLSAFFLAFTRDTNAYLLLFVGLLLLAAVLLGWARWRTLIVVAVFGGIFLLNNATADLGGRWVFPLINVVGRRVLHDTRAIQFLHQSCGMPVNSALMSMRYEFANGRERAFFEDPALEEFRAWLLENGKTCYARMLLADPINSLGQPLAEFNGLMAFERVRRFYVAEYDPLIPFALEPVFYPIHFSLAIWVVLTLAAIVGLFLQLFKEERAWAGFLLLSLPIFPHLFITWHGDAMAPERHAIPVALQIALSAWMLVLLVVDRIARERWQKVQASTPPIQA